MLFPCSEERIVGLRCDGQPLSPITLNPFIPLKTKQTKKISSLTSFWSSPVMSVETLRLLTNWLVVSVLRLTGVLWSVPADGCPILGPAQLLCAAVMWLFLPGVVLTTWLSFYLKHKHARTQIHTAGQKMDLNTKHPASFISSLPGWWWWRVFDTTLTCCLSDDLKPPASSFSVFFLIIIILIFLRIVGWHVLRSINPICTLSKWKKKIIDSSFFASFVLRMVSFAVFIFPLC